STPCRDPVFPLARARPSEPIRRSGFKNQSSALPSRPVLGAEAERALGRQRYAHNLAKGWAVLVPADGGARRVFGDQHVLQIRRDQRSKMGNLLPQRPKEGRSIAGFL